MPPEDHVPACGAQLRLARGCFASSFSASRRAVSAEGSGCGGRSCGPTALRCAPQGRAASRCAPSPAAPVRCAQTDAASMMTKRAARADPGAVLLVAAHRPRRVPPDARSGPGLFGTKHHERCRRDGAGQTRCAAGAEKVSRDTNGPVDRLCLANAGHWPGAPASQRAWPRAQRASTSYLRICPSVAPSPKGLTRSELCARP